MHEPIEKTKAILVGIPLGTDEDFDYQMNELAGLCEARDIEIVDTITQNLDHPISKTYIGSGKLLEIKQQIDVLNANLVVFLDELSPIQLKNIEAVLDCEVIDRTMLILEIFELRARTKEAMLQVEIANLKYMLPRLIGSYTHLSRTGGGGAGGSGARRGSGETKLEEDKRHIERRIQKATEELKNIVQSRQTARKLRKSNNTKTVAFVGYTNAGKSTTINSLLELFHRDDEKKVFAKNMLFATLETATRLIKLPTNQEFLITDTVGFVSHLPHHLIESFKSTLEEIKEAHLIVHVVDAASPYANMQIETTNRVLTEIGVKDIPIVYAFCKADLVKNPLFLPHVDANSILISNAKHTGFDKLIAYIQNTLFSDQVTCTLLIPYASGEIFSLLKEKAHVHHSSYENEGILLTCTMSRHLYQLYMQYEQS